MSTHYTDKRTTNRKREMRAENQPLEEGDDADPLSDTVNPPLLRCGRPEVEYDGD